MASRYHWSQYFLNKALNGWRLRMKPAQSQRHPATLPVHPLHMKYLLCQFQLSSWAGRHLVLLFWRWRNRYVVLYTDEYFTSTSFYLLVNPNASVGTLFSIWVQMLTLLAVLVQMVYFFQKFLSWQIFKFTFQLLWQVRGTPTTYKFDYFLNNEITTLQNAWLYHAVAMR